MSLIPERSLWDWAEIIAADLSERFALVLVELVNSVYRNEIPATFLHSSDESWRQLLPSIANAARTYWAITRDPLLPEEGIWELCHQMMLRTSDVERWLSNRISANTKKRSPRPQPSPASLDKWMNQNVPHGTKRSDAIADCRKATGATFRMAAEAWSRVPPEIKLFTKSRGTHDQRHKFIGNPGSLGNPAAGLKEALLFPAIPGKGRTIEFGPLRASPDCSRYLSSKRSPMYRSTVASTADRLF